MKVVIPSTIGDSDLDSSTVAEPHADETAYNASTVYVDGDQVVDTTNHLTYESLIGTADTVTISNDSPAVITWATHGLIENTPILFTTTGSLPTGLTASTIYYVLDPQLNSFNVSATVGGTAINTSSAGSGTHTATANPNLGYALTDTTAWAEIGPTIKWAMFDLNNNTATEDDDEIIVSVSPTDRHETLGLLGVSAQTLYVQVKYSTADSTRWNYLGRSENFTTTWSQTNLQTVTGDDARGPFYDLSADLIVPNTSSVEHHVSQVQTSSSGDKCFSVYAKAETYDGIRLLIIDGTNFIYADFDLSDGTVSTSGNSGIWTNLTAGIQPAKNGFYRPYLAGTQNAGSALTCRIYVLNGGVSTFAGDGTGGVHLFGAMLDQGLELRNYLPNSTTGDVGGSTDNIVYEYEENLSSREVIDYWDYLLTEWDYKSSIFLEGLPPYSGSEVTVALIDDGSTVSCSGFVLGQATDLGRNAEYGAEAGELNFSSITRDTLSGRSTLTRRLSVPTADLTVTVSKERVNAIRELRTALNAAPALWVGVDDDTEDYFESVFILGIYKRFAINLTHPNDAVISLQLEGL